MKVSQFITIQFLLLCLILLAGCSFHFDQGRELEAEERWEEAAIEYRRAYVDDPYNHEVQEALQRVNRKVARGNLVRYREYLDRREYRKAYARLENVLVQDPDLENAQSELEQWRSILLTGKVQMEFSRVREKLRLAEKMRMEVHLNSPSGEVLKGEISNENGIFIIEDLLYRTAPERLSEYTLNSIGLFLVRRDNRGFSTDKFKRFINFRILVPGSVEGRLHQNKPSPKKKVSEHRQVLHGIESILNPWFPPRLVRYGIQLDQDRIRVVTAQKRREFAPDVLYLNNRGNRAFLDFGTLEMELNKKTRKWSIHRKPYRNPSDDYFEDLSRNLALNRYFSYDQVYRFVN